MTVFSEPKARAILNLSNRCGSTLASLFEGGGFAKGEDGGSVVIRIGHSPSHDLRRDSPLKEGAKASFANFQLSNYSAGTIPSGSGQ